MDQEKTKQEETNTYTPSEHPQSKQDSVTQKGIDRLIRIMQKENPDITILPINLTGN